jgi:hypothetical protein
MKFGIWVEPERVALSLVGDRRVQESWLATSGGNYGANRAAQLCFASTAVRRWVLDRLIALINSVQPDYLKWDNNMWINCDRPGHGHGATDGNFAHVKGLYDVLSALRAAYPDLVMENVSGGGNRLDLGMLQFSDVAWMSDHTGPSVHVRHNLEGLSAVFPPAYLLSFVIDQGEEPLHRPADISLYFRSRMQGALGLSFAMGECPAGYFVAPSTSSSAEATASGFSCGTKCPAPSTMRLSMSFGSVVRSAAVISADGCPNPSSPPCTAIVGTETAGLPASCRSVSRNRGSPGALRLRCRYE